MRRPNSTRLAGARALWLAVVTASLGGLSIGYGIGIIGWAALLIRGELGLSDVQEESLISAGSLAAIVGAVVGGLAADRLGRRRTFLVSAALFVLGAIGSGLSQSVDQLVAARFVLGLAVGTVFVCAPLYLAEISPSRMRGRLVVVNSVAIALGIFTAYGVDYLVGGTSDWRLMLSLGAVPAVLLGALALVVPESPRWLLSRGNRDRAAVALGRLRSVESDSAEVEAKLDELALSLETIDNGRSLVDPEVRPQLKVGIGLAALRSLGGLNVITYYSPTILGYADFPSASTSVVATLGLGGTILLSRVFTMGLVDRIGRRKLLIRSTALVAIGFSVVGTAFLLSSDASVVPWLTMAGLLLTVASYNVSSSVIPLLLVETFPQDVRGRGLSLTNGVLNGLDFVVAATFLSLVAWLGRSSSFFLFAAINVFAMIYFFRSVRETNGKTLEESSLVLTSTESGPEST